jgi:hypothetical protein
VGNADIDGVYPSTYSTRIPILDGIVPDPDIDAKYGITTFENAVGRWKFQGRYLKLANFLRGKKILSQVIDDDPEFETWTYGLSPSNKLINSIINYSS